MKFYVESLDKFYDSAAEAQKAEELHLKKLELEKARKAKLDEERKNRAKEVETAYQAALDAEKKYWEVKKKFIEDYGSWHMTYKNTDNGIATFFDELLKLF